GRAHDATGPERDAVLAPQPGGERDVARPQTRAAGSARSPPPTSFPAPVSWRHRTPHCDEAGGTVIASTYFRRLMRTCVTAILAIIFLCAGIGGAIAADATPEASPAAPSADAVLAALNASIEWYRDARVTMRDVNRTGALFA